MPLPTFLRPRRDAAATRVLAVPEAERRRTWMIASLLLDYPGPAFDARLRAVDEVLGGLGGPGGEPGGGRGGLPGEIAADLRAFLDHAARTDRAALEADYVATFDLKRKCCLYLSYYREGDTRRRGAALVAFLGAYRAAGWEFDADELPDFLPAVLEFAARSDAPEASELLAAHRDGIEVLLGALDTLESPWAHVVRAVCRSLPELDDATRERVLALVADGPPAETVGLSFLGNIPPYTPAGAAHEEVRA